MVAFFFFHLGPEHMPLQPVGLLCYPCTILMFIRRSYFRRQSVSSSVRPKRPLVMKDGTVWARNIAGNFCLKMSTSTLHFRELLYATILRHGTDGFTSPPKEGMLRIFLPLKNPTALAGLNPQTWVPKASTLPLDHGSRFYGGLVIG